MSRIQTAYLADPAHTLPMPRAQRLFSTEGELVDVGDPFWIMLLRDGSVTLEAPKSPQDAAPAAHETAPASLETLPSPPATDEAH